MTDDELKAIEEQFAGFPARPFEASSSQIEDLESACRALLAEVKRLRAIAPDAGELERIKNHERATIVEWLRSKLPERASNWDDRHEQLHSIADAIERGEHAP